MSNKVKILRACEQGRYIEINKVVLSPIYSIEIKDGIVDICLPIQDLSFKVTNSAILIGVCRIDSPKSYEVKIDGENESMMHIKFKARGIEQLIRVGD